MASSLVSCEWLKEQLDKGNTDVKVLDGTWNMPMWKRDANQEYSDGHIAGGVRFDISVVANKESSLGLTLPSAEQFQKQVGEMGISNTTHVVIYGNQPKLGFFATGRVWWMFKIFGHEKVSLLDGGLPKWIASGYPVVKGPQEQIAAVPYVSTFNPALLKNLGQVKESLAQKNGQVVDARSKGRFDGTAPEPNPKLKSGHMLGSFCIPFTTMIDSDTKTLKSREDIKEVFESAGVDLDKPIVVSCGSAVASCVLAFSLNQLGIAVPVYDGSWTDWVQNAPDETKHLGIKGEDL